MERTNDSHIKKVGIVLLIAVFMAFFTFLCGTALAADMPEAADAKLVCLILPEHELIYGCMDGDYKMLLLMRNSEKELVFVGCVYNEQERNWTTTESAPLPEGTILGVENFTHSLGIPTEKGEYNTVSLAAYADGTWGISMIMPAGDGGLFLLGSNYISDGVRPLEGIVCDHPWSDITKIDWMALPGSYKGAIEQSDCSMWAAVSNPKPTDRLNLREKKDAASGSLGKYYNGTPVRVLERLGTWTKVDICGVQGYMLSEYLTYGEKARHIHYAGPYLMPLENAHSLTVYDAVNEHGKAAELTISGDTGFYVLGILWDEWYHVWFYDLDMGGYVRQKDLWAGNG